MDTPKTLVTPSKNKDFTISKEKDTYTLSLGYTSEVLIFSLVHKNEKGDSLNYEKSFSLQDLNNISKWFKLFDSLDEVYEDLIKIIDKKQLSINSEENTEKLVFDVNMEKIKSFEIILEKKVLSKEDIIDKLVQENKELKDKVQILEIRISNLEEQFNKFLSNGTIKKECSNQINDSNIINEEDKKLLNDWINPNNDKDIKLLYKASRDGDNYQDFYRLCEDKGPTITIALTTKGYKFGGFTSLSWKNPNNGPGKNKGYEDKSAFIFSLNKKRKYYPKNNCNTYHVCMWSDRGPSFGAGNDFCLANNCLHNDNSVNNCPTTYQTKDCELNGGKYDFKVKDYEVYSIN